MRILVSNDDGIQHPGLAALRAAVRDLGEVTVIAPDSPRSAAGHSITLHEPLHVTRLRNGGEAEEFLGISVSGSPADCVRLAIITLLKDKPDLVLSGINAGANVGINVFYSGTVAAAAEAAMLGIPAIAFSAALTPDVDYHRGGRCCRWVLDKLLDKGLAPGELINVNIPELRGEAPKGIRVCPQSTVGVEDLYHKHVTTDGREAYKVGTEYTFLTPHAESDIACLGEGYITVTPLHVDMTAHERLGALAKLDWGLPTPER